MNVSGTNLQIASYNPRLHDCSGYALGAEDFAESLRLNDLIILALDGSKPRAHIRVRGCLDSWDILDLQVDRKCRRAGIARRLVEELQRQLSNACLFLEVAENNLPAIRLYKSCAFEQTGIRKNYYNNRIDAITMRWSHSAALNGLKIA